MISVIIGDPDLFAREGIKQLLAKHGDLRVTGEAQDFFGVLQRLHECRPDVCILEIAMAGHCGLRLVRELKIQAARTPILVMSHRTERDFGLRAIRSGAAGFISKNCSDQQLAGAIRVAAQHRPYISETVSQLIAESIVVGTAERAHQELSDMDFEILCLLANGTPVSTIADICNASVNLIRARKSNILDRLHLHTDVDLVRYALKNQLIDHSGSMA